MGFEGRGMRCNCRGELIGGAGLRKGDFDHASSLGRVSASGSAWS